MPLAVNVAMCDSPGMTDLATYISRAPGRTQQEWADDFGISRSFLSEILSGVKMPGRKTMSRIAEVTDNAVPVTSWFAERARG